MHMKGVLYLIFHQLDGTYSSSPHSNSSTGPTLDSFHEDKKVHCPLNDPQTSASLSCGPVLTVEKQERRESSFLTILKEHKQDCNSDRQSSF